MNLFKPKPSQYKLPNKFGSEEFVPFDFYFSEFMAELNDVKDPEILYTFAKLSHAVNHQNSCLELKENDALQSKLALLNGISLITSESELANHPTTPLILCSGKLYLQKYFHHEVNVAQQLISRNRSISNSDCTMLNLLFPDANKGDEEQEENINQQSSQTYIDWQKVAAFQCITRQLCIITGGPGTGKTSTVVKILAALMNQNENLKVKLAAPTGKAAARLGESIRDNLQTLPPGLESNIPSDVMTVHRLLGMRANGHSFKYHKDRKIPLDLLILDEISMIDLAMFDKILSALPDHCRLIMLGDPDQLLSVESGSVISDLHKLGQHYDEAYLQEIKNELGYQIPKTKTGKHVLSNAFCHLTRSYRFDISKGIGRLASNIQNKLLTELQSDGEVLYITEFTLHSLSENLKAVYQHYIDLMKDKADPRLLLAEFERSRVLAPMREGKMGIIALNDAIESSIDLKEGHQSIYHGKPIMITRNDYALGLFNGDIGICFLTQTLEFNVIFHGSKGEFNTFPLTLLPNFEACFVMSIHKSQGSEFENISVILPSLESKNNSLYTRELIYTAITRAKQHVTIYAKKDDLLTCLSKDNKRSSGLIDRLIDRLIEA